MNCPTREQIESTVKAKGYKWFENNEYEWDCMKRTILKITRS